MLLGNFFTIINKEITDNSATLLISINAAHPIFEGHFPGQPVVPGVCMIQMIKEMMESIEGKPLQNRMVVAYLAGMPVEPDYFSTIPACTNPNQTGCVCSWRTFKEGHTDEFIDNEKFTAIVTNPLTWDTAQLSVTRKLNEGSVLLKFNKLKPKVAGAAVHGGVLWTEQPHFFGSRFIKNPNYHIADYNFYYLSVRKNVQQRINAFWKR